MQSGIPLLGVTPKQREQEAAARSIVRKITYGAAGVHLMLEITKHVTQYPRDPQLFAAVTFHDGASGAIAGQRGGTASISEWYVLPGY